MIEHILNDRRVSRMLDMVNEDHILQHAIAVQQIPSPTFHEGERATYVTNTLAALNLADIQTDELGNVYARISGGNGPQVLVTAHMDTVFPRETDLTILCQQDRIYGPGLGDNAVGVAALIALAENLSSSGWRPPGDLWLVANVSEEGLGDLQGMRRVIERLGKQVCATIVLEGAAFGRVYRHGIGVQRYLIQACTSGGHPWMTPGGASAIHILIDLAKNVTDLRIHDRPRTTLNIGRIRGGISINTIAHHAEMELDIRSEDSQALADISNEVEVLVEEATAQPNASVEFKICGSRPSGQINKKHPLVQLAVEALHQVGCADVQLEAGSTDANIPLSENLPAICIGLTTGGNAHRQDEFIAREPLTRGMQQLILVAIGSFHL